MEEVWKDVVGYEDYFTISNHGRLFGKRSGRVLKWTKTEKGYLAHATRLGGRKSKAILLRAHRLVADAFIENDCGRPEVNHIDGDKTNNHVDNLEWVTKSENALHAYDTGLNNKEHLLGANNSASFFKTELDRKDAYDAFISSGLSMRKYAKTLGVTHSVVRLLVRDYAN